MSKLSRTEIAALAKGAGFSGNNVNIAVAVAMAESGGNPKAHNPVGRDNSYGLWQINMLGGMGPERRSRYNLKSNEDLWDPATNARVAYGIWKGSGWSAWTTYTRGTYKKFMTDDLSNVTATSSSASVTSSSPQSSDTRGEPILGITAAINKFGENFLKGFASFGAIAVAVTLLILGFVIIMRNPIASLAGASKLGKVAKVAKKVAA